MHPDFDCPEAHYSRNPLPPLPEPDRTCPGCDGSGACWCDECEGRPVRPHATCEWCDGKGEYTLRSLTAAPPAAVPADRPTMTAVGSPSLTDETHGPAR